LSHLLPLQISFESIEEESIVWYAVPVKNFLLLLRSNAVVLVKEIKESTLGFFQGGVGARLQVSQVGEDTLLEFLRVLHGSAEGLESKGKAAYNIRAGDVKEVVPADESAHEAWTEDVANIP
jgi:hypothetical protein